MEWSEISETQNLTSKSVKSELAGQRGKHALILIFPSRTSFESFRELGRLYSRPLLERLEEFNITKIDLTESFLAYLKKRK